MSESMQAVEVVRRAGAQRVADRDLLAIEEPLEIRVGSGPRETRRQAAISITMRTPGSDRELAAGFLFTEAIIREGNDIEAIEHCGARGTPAQTNTIRVDLRPGVTLDLERLARHFYTSSSCGVCGKGSLEALRAADPPTLESGPKIDAALLLTLPALLRHHQEVFDSTGGLHASALFDPAGKLLDLREDVGRHNALDKLIGAELLKGAIPLRDRILLLSGRASFELVQKALMAGISLVAAIGAPSSLAVELAREHGMTLVGFLREERFNVYCGETRIG